jgi:hypothetical protein
VRHAFKEFRVGQLDPVNAAGVVVAVEDEALAPFEDRLAALEMADAQLRSLEVEQDRRRPPELLFERPDDFDQARLLAPVAVAHVDPERVRSGEHQPLDRPGVARRRAERGQDFHLARARRKDVGHLRGHSRLI